MVVNLIKQLIFKKQIQIYLRKHEMPAFKLTDDLLDIIYHIINACRYNETFRSVFAP